MSVTLGVGVGRRAIRAREGAEVVVEGAILFDDDDDMLDHATSGLAIGSTGAVQRQRRRTQQYRQADQGNPERQEEPLHPLPTPRKADHRIENRLVDLP